LQVSFMPFGGSWADLTSLLMIICPTEIMHFFVELNLR